MYAKESTRIRALIIGLLFALAAGLPVQAADNAATTASQPQLAIPSGPVARDRSQPIDEGLDAKLRESDAVDAALAAPPLAVLDVGLRQTTAGMSPIELVRVIVFLDYLPHREIAARARQPFQSELRSVEEGIEEILRRQAAERDTAAPIDAMNYAAMRATSDADRQRLSDLTREHDALSYRMKSAANAEIKEAVAASQAPIITVIRRLGGEFEFAATAGNLVVARVPVGALEALSTTPGVLRVAGDRKVHGHLNIADDATRVTTTDNQGPWDFGVTGGAYDAAIIDSGIDLAHPGMANAAGRINYYTWYLSAAVGDPDFNETCCDEDDYNGHGVHVAGIVGSYGTPAWPTRLGMAFGADKLVHLKAGWDDSATGGSSMYWSDKFNIVDRALYDTNQLRPIGTFVDDVDVINLSYGGNTTSDDTDAGRFWDSAIATYADLLVTISAGNSGPANALFTDPASAYNPITVANVDDRNTAARNDDIIRASSTRGPTASGRRKPDIAAPGTNISSANTFWETQFDYVDISGTSMAAPMVAGVGTDLMDAGVIDELRVKALLLNTAQKNEPGINFEGDADGWSPAFGWGYMNAQAAYHHRFDTVVANLAPRDTDGSSDADYVLYRVFMQDEGAAGEGRDRATMVWNREAVYNSAAPPTTFYASADMDLRLYQESNGAFLDTDQTVLDNVHQVRVPGGYIAQDTIVKAYSFSTSFAHGGATQQVALAMEEGPQIVTMPKPGGVMQAGGSWRTSVEPNEEFQLTFNIANNGEITVHSNTLTPDLSAGYTIVSGPATASIGSIEPGDSAGFTWTLRAPPTPGAVNQLAVTHDHTSYGEAPDGFRWALLQTVEIDATAPTPDPMCFSTPPFGSGLDRMSMTACQASDLHGPVEYFLFWTGTPTGGPGLTDSGWQTGRSYTDLGMGSNHQYCYITFARDTAIGLNQTASSPEGCGWTWIEPSIGVTFGTVTTTSIEAFSLNTPPGLTRGSSGLFVQNLTAGFSTGWKQNNTPWTLGGLNANAPYTYVIKARNGESVLAPDSPLRTIHTLANQPAAAPFGAVTETSIVASLNPNGNPFGTEYFFQNVSAGTSSGWTTATAWNSGGLSCGTGYTFQVRARNGDSIQTSVVPLGVAVTAPCSTDSDMDGVADNLDNCIFAPNSDQRDTDGDGFGNLCDADLNNNCIVNSVDLGLFKSVFFTSDPHADFNGDGVVNAVDLGILKLLFFAPPGPSGVPNICEGPRPDLTVQLINPPTTVSCPGGQGTCVHDVDLLVIEQNGVAVGDPFDVTVFTDNGLGTTFTVPGIGPGAVVPFGVTLGPGNNCYNPNCEVTGEVDSGAAIGETDESNNFDSRLDLG